MSRLGKKPIQIPAGVTVTVSNGVVSVNGPKGSLTYTLRPEIYVKLVESGLETGIAKEAKDAVAFWGLTVALVKNMIKGVSEGFEKKLELVGVGYRVKAISNTQLSLSVGYSHPVEYSAPQGITFEVEGDRNITIKGIDKQAVGLAAANIRKVRVPEPYKGKGIKYIDEVVRRKAGKTGKA